MLEINILIHSLEPHMRVNGLQGKTDAETGAEPYPANTIQSGRRRDRIPAPMELCDD